jgi:hypothetical protein
MSHCKKIKPWTFRYKDYTIKRLLMVAHVEESKACPPVWIAYKDNPNDPACCEYSRAACLNSLRQHIWDTKGALQNP